MGDKIREKLTSKGINVIFSRDRDNETLEIGSKSEIIQYGKLTPPNMDLPDGPTMKLLTGEGVSIELSKRRATMPFWHRNMDFDEVIICVKGTAEWLTENGTYQLKEGEMLLIPRGVSHTASAKNDSNYMAIEIKSRAPLQNNVQNVKR